MNLRSPIPGALWKTRPLPGKLEKAAFIEYLKKKHGDIETLRMRWNMTPEELCSWEQVELPDENDFAEPWAPGSQLVRSPRAYDFNRFGQEVFANWVKGHVEVLKEATKPAFLRRPGRGRVSPPNVPITIFSMRPWTLLATIPGGRLRIWLLA